MVIRIRCPRCGRALRFPEETLGRTGRCCDQECQARFLIRSPDEELAGPHRRPALGAQRAGVHRLKLVEHVVVPSVAQEQEADLLDAYEVYEAGSMELARQFLAGISVSTPRYYVVVETPDGVFGRDHHGGYEPSRTWRGSLHEWNRNKGPVSRLAARLNAASEALAQGRFGESAALLRPVAGIPLVRQFVETVLECGRGEMPEEEFHILLDRMRTCANQYSRYLETR